MKKHKILMIDDDPLFLEGYRSELAKEYNISTAASFQSGLDLIRSTRPEILLLDISLSTEREGLEMLPHLKREFQDLTIIMVTNWDSHSIFKEAINKGADDFFIKSDNLELLKTIIENQILTRLEHINYKKKEQDFPLAYSPKMRMVLAEAQKVATAHCPVLITGESGTGKEVVAKYIHENSRRQDQPFVAINCAAIPENLLESELFGYEKGAFTGAVSRKRGKIESADTGTLFLDELEDLPAKSQAAILRVTQEMKFERLGSNHTQSVDVRIIGACQNNLKTVVDKGIFREDLYYRLAVYRIEIPPLRDRKEDILPFAQFFLRKFCTANQLKQKKISHAALLMLKNYGWPGNVRELENVIISSAIKSSDREIRPTDLDTSLAIPEQPLPYEIAKYHSIENFQRNYFQDILIRNNGNISASAREAGISRPALQKIIRQLNLKI